MRISDIFFEDFGVRKTKFTIQHFLRNNGKENVRIDTKLPDDVKVIKIGYNPIYAFSTVIIESKEFYGDLEEIQIILTKIAKDEYREREMVSFT